MGSPVLFTFVQPPDIVRRPPAPQSMYAFPLRPPGAALTTLPLDEGSDGIFRPYTVFGYQAWAGPMSAGEPAARSNLPWIARLEPPVRRVPQRPMAMARPTWPITPPDPVPAVVWQSQAARELPKRRISFQTWVIPPPLPFVDTTFALSWWKHPPETPRRKPEPRGFGTRSPFPLDASSRSDLPWLPPALIYRPIRQTWAPTPTLPWNPPATVPPLAWAPPLHPVIYRRPDPRGFYAKPPFPTDGADRSDLPWLAPQPLIVRPVRWTPPNQDGFVPRPPDQPTPVLLAPQGVPRAHRTRVDSLGPFTVLPAQFSGNDLVWLPPPTALWKPWNATGPAIWVWGNPQPQPPAPPADDQWCVDLRFSLMVTPRLMDEVGIAPALINPIGLAAGLDAQENC